MCVCASVCVWLCSGGLVTTLHVLTVPLFAAVQEAVPATAMTVCDWWILEVMVLLAGLGKNADVHCLEYAMLCSAS